MSRVDLYLYDLSNGLARQLSPMLLGRQIDGVWHTGVVVWGVEYFYGGGIVAARAGTAIPDMRYELISLGTTTRTKVELEHFLRSIAHRFTAETYQLLRHNCNNFSDEVVRFLLGGIQGIPGFILNLPGEVLETPLGQMIASFEGQLRDRTRGGGGLNPFGTMTAAPSETLSAPTAEVRFIEFGPSPDQLTLAVARLNQPAISEFFQNVNWRVAPLIAPAFWTQLFPSFSAVNSATSHLSLTLQRACILRHVCLNTKVLIPTEPITTWLIAVLDAAETVGATYCWDKATRVMVLIAVVNLTARTRTLEKCGSAVSRLSQVCMGDNEVAVRRAVGKLLVNFFTLAKESSDEYALTLTTTLTRLEEEEDVGVGVEIIRALEAAVQTKKSAFKEFLKDILGEEQVRSDHLNSKIRSDPKIVQALQSLNTK